MKLYDATIIGAGPAGLSTAIELLRKGWRVLILDKATLPREKVCGGFLGPENISLLEKYDILESLLSAGAHKVSSACLSAAKGASVKIPIRLGGKQAYGLAVSRKLLDLTLMDKAKSLGVDLMDSVKVMNIQEGQVKGLAVRHIREGQVEMVQTRHLIYASGVNRKGNGSADAFCFGVSAMFEGVREMDEDVFLHFIDKGHLGTNRFEDGVTNVCYVADKKLFESVGGDLEKLFNVFLEQNDYVRRQLSAAKRVTPWKGLYVPKAAQPRFVQGDAFCVGDAVDVIHPIAGAGISLALSSGSLLGQLMSLYEPSTLSFDDVKTSYEKQWKKMFNLRIKLSRIWGYLGHNVALANGVMKLFSYKKEIFDKVFEFHHQQVPFKAVNLAKERMNHAKN